MNKKQILENSMGTEVRSIRKHYTEDELNAVREKFAENEIAKAAMEDELSALKKRYKTSIDDFKAVSKEYRLNIKNKFVDEDHECAKVPNYVSKKMEYYDTQTGDMLDSRKLRPDEKQLNIVTSKTA